jgi:hypothetical protein
MSDKALKAHHESGHAVFATIKGIPYRRVLLKDDDRQGYSGAIDITEAELKQWLEAVPEPERQTRVDCVVQFKAVGALAAGRYATEARLNPGICTDLRDELQLRNLFREYARNPSGESLGDQAKLDRSEHLRGQVQQLVNEPRFWRAVSAVADKLQASGELSSTDVSDICKRVNSTV